MINAHNEIRMITAMMIRFSLSLVWTFCLLWYLVLVAIARFVYFFYIDLMDLKSKK